MPLPDKILGEADEPRIAAFIAGASLARHARSALPACGSTRCAVDQALGEVEQAKTLDQKRRQREQTEHGNKAVGEELPYTTQRPSPRVANRSP